MQTLHPLLMLSSAKLLHVLLTPLLANMPHNANTRQCKLAPHRVQRFREFWMGVLPSAPIRRRVGQGVLLLCLRRSFELIVQGRIYPKRKEHQISTRSTYLHFYFCAHICTPVTNNTRHLYLYSFYRNSSRSSRQGVCGFSSLRSLTPVSQVHRQQERIKLL